MRLGHPIVELAVTTSTMDDVERLAAEGAGEGLIVVADEQTAGRGRAGRGWSAPAGTALLCSMLLRPPLPPNRLSTLPLVSGVAVAEAIEACAPVACHLKWPNDVWIGGLKVAGILMKATTPVNGEGRVILGIGINVSAGSQDLPPAATSVAAASGTTVSRSSLLETLIVRLHHHYDLFITSNGRPDLDSWSRRAAMLGEVVTIEDGGVAVTGRFLGVDEDGALLLDAGATLRRIYAGDLSRGPVAAHPGVPGAR